MASALFWNGFDGFERETYATLRFFFERCSTFLDVGANYGFYSLIGALLNRSLLVTSFEPVPQIFQRLTTNIALNGLEARVFPHQLALSDRTGHGIFHLPRSASLDYESTGTLAQESWQQRKHSPSFEVETVRFDDFESKNPTKIDLVKIDVEDFEAAVLSGMQRVILRDRPFIVCEVLPRQHKNKRTHDIIRSLGYLAYWITPFGHIKITDFDFERQVTNFLLSPVSVEKEVVTDLNLFWSATRI